MGNYKMLLEKNHYKSVVEQQKQRQQLYVERSKRKQLEKRKLSLYFAKQQLQKYSNQPIYYNHFTAHIRSEHQTTGGETDDHVRKKFERWLYWRKFGATVVTECELKYKGKIIRPDLIILFNNGEIRCEEIVVSEREASIVEKKNKYPFPIEIIES